MFPEGKTSFSPVWHTNSFTVPPSSRWSHVFEEMASPGLLQSAWRSLDGLGDARGYGKLLDRIKAPLWMTSGGLQLKQVLIWQMGKGNDHQQVTNILNAYFPHVYGAFTLCLFAKWLGFVRHLQINYMFWIIIWFILGNDRMFQLQNFLTNSSVNSLSVWFANWDTNMSAK